MDDILSSPGTKARPADYLVVAKDKAAAANYARSHRLSNWRYANPVLMAGINNLTVVWVPGCEENPHIREIKESLNLSMYSGLSHYHETG